MLHRVCSRDREQRLRWIVGMQSCRYLESMRKIDSSSPSSLLQQDRSVWRPGAFVGIGGHCGSFSSLVRPRPPRRYGQYPSPSTPITPNAERQWHRQILPLSWPTNNMNNMNNIEGNGLVWQTRLEGGRKEDLY